MGGAQAGEVAAQDRGRGVRARLPGRTRTPSRSSRGSPRRRTAASTSWRARTSSRSGMGTTLTGVLLSDDEVSIVHVGDSRAYLLRDGELRQLTRDHSLVEELRRRGQLTVEEAEEHPQRSIITRALGPEARRRARRPHAPGSERRRVPDLQRRPHEHGARGARARDPDLRATRSSRPSTASSTRRTGWAGATTSRSILFRVADERGARRHPSRHRGSGQQETAEQTATDLDAAEVQAARRPSPAAQRSRRRTATGQGRRRRRRRRLRLASRSWSCCSCSADSPCGGGRWRQQRLLRRPGRSRARHPVSRACRTTFRSASSSTTPQYVSSVQARSLRPVRAQAAAGPRAALARRRGRRDPRSGARTDERARTVSCSGCSRSSLLVTCGFSAVYISRQSELELGDAHLRRGLPGALPDRPSLHPARASRTRTRTCSRSPPCWPRSAW